MELTTVTIERRDPDQGGDLLAVELSQFRQLDQQAGRRTGPTPGTAPNNAAFAEARRRTRSVGRWLLPIVESVCRAVRACDECSSARFWRWPSRAGSRSRTELHKLPPSRDQLAKGGLFFRADFTGPGLRLLAKAGNHAGVEPIGLGQDPEATSEVADLPGIDHGHR